MERKEKIGAKRGLRRFFENEEGSSAMEYATMLSLIGVTLLPVVQSLGEKVSGVSRKVADTFASAPEGPPLPSQSFSPAPVDPTLQ